MSLPDNDPQLINLLGRMDAFMLSRKTACHMVGGFLRDQLLGRKTSPINVDFAVPRGALEICRELAAHLKAAYVPLDEKTGSARLVISAGAVRYELDVSDYRAPTLEADLALRDFTINAIAIRLSDWLKQPDQPSVIIDPLKGRQALVRRELVACFPATFQEDPVRILRAFRFMAQLGFSLPKAMQEAMQHGLPRLAEVSGERIRDELMKIFDTDQASEAFKGLDAAGALDKLFPELIPGRGLDQGDFHHLDVLGHQIEAVFQADRFMKDFAEFSEPLRGPLAAYCSEELVDGRSRKSLIKLATLLHDVGKPSSRQVHPDGEIWFIGHEHTGEPLARAAVDRLKLSNREADMVCQLVLHHLRPGFLSREEQLTRRAVYRFFKELGDHGPSCLLEWWADRMATRGKKSRLHEVDLQRAFLEEMLNAYFFKAEEVVKPPRLIDGRQLMAAFSLSPGPLIGDLLEQIEEAQAEGRVGSADEALELAKKYLASLSSNT